jgi:hypothetical protein
MRRIVPTVLVALALLASATADAANGHSGASKVCPSRPAHSRVVMADTQAEVYTAPEDPEYPEFLGVYGCSYKYRRPYRLGPVPSKGGGPGNGTGVELKALAGPVVAVAESGGGIQVRDLLDGRVLHTVSPPPREKLGSVFAMVVKSDGAVAWIVEKVEAGEQGDYQVHALWSSGSRLLASVGYDERSSLALAGSTLYWTQEGKPESASLN